MKRVLIVGVVNVTPDSFSDGGQFLAADRAVAQARQLWEAGADWVEVGGESTRPGSDSVLLEEERRRVLPVIEALADDRRPLMVDTQKPELAREALQAGAAGVNDVGGLRLDAMRELVEDLKPTVCVMHRQGDPKTMQVQPEYGDVCAEVFGELTSTADKLMRAGLLKDQVWLDPGIGFGKSLEHNLELLANVRNLVRFGIPVMIGISRKSFLGKLANEPVGQPNWEAREELATAIHALVLEQGVTILRVHDVTRARRAVTAWEAWRSAWQP